MSEPASRPSPLGLPFLLLVVLLVETFGLRQMVSLWPYEAWVQHIAVDVWGWLEFWDRCRQGLVPYVHFTKEYPALAGAFYWAMSPFVPREGALEILLVHGAFMAAADVLNVGLFYAAVRRYAPATALALTALFAFNATSVVLSPFRFESWLVTLILLGYLAHQRDRPALSAFFWSLAAALKWFPVFFLVARELHAWFVLGRRRQWLRSAAILAGVLVLTNLPFVIAGFALVGHARSWVDTYGFHVRRNLYGDTLLGVIELWLGRFPPERFGSYWSGALVLLALWRGRRLEVERAAVLACVGALFLNRVYSPQFHLWFYPFLLLAAARDEAEGPRLVSLFVALDLLNVLVYPMAFTYALPEVAGKLEVGRGPLGGPWTVVFSAAIVARTVVLALLARVLLRR